jgi:rRNA pseudouridine-1189 N-methylase Emg1 (Nep1/Mra1 family)
MRKKYPPDKSLGEMKVNAYTMTLEGSRALQIIEVKNGKLEEYLERMGKAIVMMTEGGEITITYKIWLTQMEAFANLGRNPPEELQID